VIWHIFKKDVRLLWPFAALAALIHGVNAVPAAFSTGIDTLFFVSIPLALVSLLSLVALVVSVAQQDLVPGERQDWLIRPINRLHLVAAKLLFVVLLGLAPICAADVALGLVHELPLGDVVAASVRRSAALLCYICVPTLIVAAMTRTLTEFVVTVAVAAIALIGLFSVTPVVGLVDTLSASGIAWITTCIWGILSVLAALTILPQQYLHRRTVRTRWLSGGALVCALLASMLPWRAGFAIQEHFAPQPGAGTAVALEYDPTAPVRLVRQGQQTGEDGALILFTLRATNLPGNTQLRPDHYTVRVLDGDGKALYQGESKLRMSIYPEPGAPLRQEDGTSAPVVAQQAVEIRSPIPLHRPGQIVRVEIDYSLTLFRAVAQDWIADVGNDQVLAGFARCTTRPRNGGDAVNMVCLSTHPWSACLAGYRIERHTGKKTWHFTSCDTVDYAPFTGAIWRDAYFRLGWFGAGQGLSAGAQTAGNPGAAANLIETLLPQDHFTRRVVIPQLRLP
jgi:hypothetical protein